MRNPENKEGNLLIIRKRGKSGGIVLTKEAVGGGFPLAGLLQSLIGWAMVQAEASFLLLSGL